MMTVIPYLRSLFLRGILWSFLVNTQSMASDQYPPMWVADHYTNSVQILIKNLTSTPCTLNKKEIIHGSYFDHYFIMSMKGNKIVKTIYIKNDNSPIDPFTDKNDLSFEKVQPVYGVEGTVFYGPAIRLDYQCGINAVSFEVQQDYSWSNPHAPTLTVLNSGALKITYSNAPGRMPYYDEKNGIKVKEIGGLPGYMAITISDF